MKPWIIGAGLIAAAASAGAAALWKMFAMPGDKYQGPLGAPCKDHASMVHDLQATIETIAGEFGERHVHGREAELEQTLRFIENRLEIHGLRPRRQTYVARESEVHNLIVEFKGSVRPREILVIGAHYDSGIGTPGANDNSSGVASALLLACRMAQRPAPARTVRIAFFVNEEEPFFQSEYMGSHVYAAECAERGEQIRGMLALETLGYYSDEPGSQHYPEGLSLGLDDVGDFVAFVGNLKSSDLVREVIGAFRAETNFPTHGVSLPSRIPGVGWSDHWAFWQHGFPALMVTDTAPYRYPHYHTAEDTPDKIDYDKLARVVDGLDRAIRRIDLV